MSDLRGWLMPGFLWVTLLLLHTTVCLGSTHEAARALIQELGCAACHSGLPGETSLEDRAPGLDDAGLRYQPAYLFEYLQRPRPLRRHIGRSRMPDFHLDPAESVALTRFLQQQRAEPGLGPASLPEVQPLDPARYQNAAWGRELIDSSGCLSCHSLAGRGGETAVDLSMVSHRLQRRWVRQFLVDPQRFLPGTPMPSVFYIRDQGRLSQAVPRAAEKIDAIVDFLFSLDSPQAGIRAGRFEEAVKHSPDADPTLGARIFHAQNCAGCHRHESISGVRDAPDLSIEGSRVKRAWLETFLERPRPVRLFGTSPGGGSRMPDFGLSPQEIGLLADYLMAQVTDFPDSERQVRESPLSPFAAEKARRLLEEKLSCLGCHRLGDQGGRIGPDLNAVPARLQPQYLDQIVREPAAVVPEGVMPRVSLTDNNARLIVSFLLQQDPSSAPERAYPSLTRHPPGAPPTGRTGAALYGRYCGQCHGERGDGAGFNAAYLPVPPTRFADARYMTQRPDDTLFDGIYAGGYILNKSHRMPPWGATLTPKEIRDLVAHTRHLCDCSGPDWSLDN